MEASLKTQETGSPAAIPGTALVPSPTSNSSSTSSSCNSHSNGQYHPAHNLHHHHYKPHPPPPSSPTTPKQQQKNHQTITRSESNNPCPTTFVQANTSSFKQVVQMLTGSSETVKLASQSKPTTNPDHQSHHHLHLHQHHQQSMCRNPIPPVKTTSKLKPPKLYERRNNLKNLKINPSCPGFASSSGLSPRNAEILSPSMLDFPSLVLSPVTPLIPDPFNRSPSTFQNDKPDNNGMVVDKAAEEKAIAEKGFYLHPSPASTPRESEPRLLPLFPVTSPRVSGSDSNCS